MIDATIIDSKADPTIERITVFTANDFVGVPVSGWSRAAVQFMFDGSLTAAVITVYAGLTDRFADRHPTALATFTHTEINNATVKAVDISDYAHVFLAVTTPETGGLSSATFDFIVRLTDRGY